MGRTSDGVKQLIERVFRAKKKIELAIYERKHGYGASTFTGGASTGHCRVPDPTAMHAIRNAVELEMVTLEDGFRVIFPERWLRVFNAVREFCSDDPIDREIFSRRYDKCDNGIPISIEQSVYSRHLLKIMNHAKMCAAQEQLVRFF